MPGVLKILIYNSNIFLYFTAYEYWALEDRPNERYYRIADYWFGMIEYLFLRFSECLNPLFYNLGSAKMRRHTKKFLKQKLSCFVTWKKQKPSDVTNEVTSQATTNFGI